MNQIVFFDSDRREREEKRDVVVKKIRVDFGIHEYNHFATAVVVVIVAV